MSLNRNQIDNFSNHYSRIFNLWETHAKIEEYLEKYGNNHFKIFKQICCCEKGIKIIENKENRFICEILS